MRRYHHIGIPTSQPRPGERHIERLKIFIDGHENSEYGVEWMRFEADAPIPDLVRQVPHVAFEVSDLASELEGREILIPPNSPSDGVRVAFIVENAHPLISTSSPSRTSGSALKNSMEAKSFSPPAPSRLGQRRLYVATHHAGCCANLSHSAQPACTIAIEAPEAAHLIQLVFAVCMMIGAWTAWRRNPLYSARSTLRSALIALLAIVGVIALIIAAVTLTSGKSDAVIFTTLGVVIVFGTLALIFIIQAVTVPKESKPAALPHSVKLVSNNRRKMVRWVKVLAVVLGICALAGLVPGAPSIIAALPWAARLSSSPLFCCRSSTLTNRTPRPVAHSHRTRPNGSTGNTRQSSGSSGAPCRPIAWRATPASFVFARDWHRFLFPFAIIIGGVAFFVPGSWLFKGIYLAVVCGAILAIATFSGRGGASHAQKLHAKLLAAAPEVYFGRDGIFSDGVFTPWLNVSTYLVSAAIDSRQPRSLMFNFERSVPNPYGPTSIVPIHQAVLISPGTPRAIWLDWNAS